MLLLTLNQFDEAQFKVFAKKKGVGNASGNDFTFQLRIDRFIIPVDGKRIL